MHTKTNYFAVGLIVASFLLSLSLGTGSASAASASITTNSSITLDASSAGNGVSIDEESINVTTTCTKGYDLTIATSTSTNLYLNGDSTKTAAYTAVDGTSALDSTNNTNKWGYTITSDATSSTVFSPLSTTASSIRTISQTTDVTSETIPIYYGIKTDNTIDPGTYSMGNNGTITYYLTMNPLCNVVDIAYDGNNADEGSMGAVGTGVIHIGVKDGYTVNLIASNFSRDGYGFAGWSLDKDAGTKLLDNDNTNNPIVYGPQETITIPEGFADNDTDNDGIVKLYAVWLQSQGNLQGWMGCSDLDTATYDGTTGKLDLTKNSVTALTDQRDNDTYAIAKLADGKCWMIENLRLDNSATLTTANTNNPLNDGTNVTLKHSYSDTETHNTLSASQDPTATAWCQSNSASCDDQSMLFTGNTTNRASSPTANGVAMYSYGNYYNWYSATAGRGTYSFSTNNNSVAGDLCPAGWHLPKGGSSTNATNSDFWQLGLGIMGAAPSNNGYYQSSETNAAGKTGTATFRSYPNNFVYSGNVYGGSVSDRGSNGYFWSSTAGSSNYAYYLNLNSSYVSPGTSLDSKYLGRTVRCVASEPENYTLTYDANGGTGAPASQTTTANGIATFTLSSTTPTRSGYTFAGWSDEAGNEAEPGDNFTTNDPNATLYAIWTNNSCNPTATTIGTGNTTTDAVCLQDVTPSMKASLPIADATTGTYTLIDARDNQSYTVAKLADGNLWLTKNLNYSSTNLNTSHDTDIASTTFRLPESTTTSNTDNTTASIRTTNNSGNNDNGTYYSWPAAIASTASYESGNVTSSICPKGWDLPVISQYTNLQTKADYKTGNLTTSVPSSFLINGGFTNGASFYQTSYSHFWTSTVSSSTAAYGARVNGTDMTTSSSTGSTYGGNKYYRKNIRCIASNGTVTINYEGNGTTEYPVTGSVASQIDVDVSLTNTKTNGFTRTGWAFNGWNTAADGTGTAIAVSTAITNLNPAPDSTITLYAQWLPQRQIIYNDNCSYNNAGCATNTDTTNTSSWTNAGSNITLGGDSYFTTKSDYAITSWNTARDGSGTSYNISSSYTVPSTITAPDQVTLYAQWSPALTINFNNNGGSGTMTSQLIPENTSKALKSNSFTAPSGNYFIGWMTEESRANNEVVYTNGATYTAPTTITPGDSITLYAKWGPRYTIVYNGNNATGGSMVSSGTELKHTNINEGSTVNLYAPNYWKTDYGFVGWSPSPTATIGGTDPIYGPMESISAPSYDTYGEEISGTKTITLYAIWLAADSTKTMQTFTASDCQALPQTTFNTSTGKITTPAGSVIALKDQRDNNVYTVAKLADGKCWMTENLRLEAENTVGNNQSLSQGYGGVFTGLDSSENANFDNVTTATPNNMYNSTNITGSSTGYRFPRYNNNNTSTSLTASYNGTGSSTYYTWYSYGNYYTWAAAMANTTYYSSATGTSGSESAGTSICPTNWTLPTSGTTTKDFGTLSRSGSGENQSSSVISNRFRAFPNNFLYSGYFNGSSAYSRGSYGLYWSRSAYGRGSSYTLYLTSTDLFPSYDYGKSNGFSVRCLIGS